MGLREIVSELRASVREARAEWKSTREQLAGVTARVDALEAGRRIHAGEIQAVRERFEATRGGDVSGAEASALLERAQLAEAELVTLRARADASDAALLQIALSCEDVRPELANLAKHGDLARLEPFVVVDMVTGIVGELASALEEVQDAEDELAAIGADVLRWFGEGYKSRTSTAEDVSEIVDAALAARTVAAPKPKKAKDKPAQATLPAVDEKQPTEKQQARTVVRESEWKAAKMLPCPECGAKPGEHCVDTGGDGDEKRRTPHGERFAQARALIKITSIPCPECDAPAGQPCNVGGRKGIHDERASAAGVEVPS